MNPLIRVNNLTYRHPGSGDDVSPALNDVSFTIPEGEMVALVGANGSGKTTLARHLNALFTPTTGEVQVNGMDTRDPTLHVRIRADVGMVFQHPEDQIVATTVEEDVAFGPENLCRLPESIREDVERALSIVSMMDNRKRQPHLLSAGQMQRVALAGVLAMQPRCIIFDEATAMLDPAGRHDVLNHMAALNRLGITVIFITHFIEEVSRAQRVLLLHQGSLVFDGSPGALFSDQALLDRSGLEHPAAARYLTAFPALFPGITDPATDLAQLLKIIPAYSGSSVTQPDGKNLSFEPLSNEIEIRDLGHVYMADTPLAHRSLEHVSITVKKSIPHGLVGATGSGKSTLLQHLNGLYLPQHGSIRVGDFDLNDPELDLKSLRRYAGLVFQNPELYFFEQYVGDEIAFGPKMIHGTDGLRERVRWAMELVGLDFDAFKDRIVSTLSGGEQRKVALASTLATRPSLLVLDEPTAGLDPHSRRSLLANLRRLQNEGMQIIFSSHNMDDIAEMVNNLSILSQGNSRLTLPVAQAFADRHMLLAAGLEQPAAVRLAQAMREKGWPISAAAVTHEAVSNEITRLFGGRTHE